jgi:DNA-binding FadR family transcriptional regulator
MVRRILRLTHKSTRKLETVISPAHRTRKASAAPGAVPGLARASLPRHQAIRDTIRRRPPGKAQAAMRRLVASTGRSIQRLEGIFGLPPRSVIVLVSRSTARSTGR